MKLGVDEYITCMVHILVVAHSHNIYEIFKLIIWFVSKGIKLGVDTYINCVICFSYFS